MFSQTGELFGVVGRHFVWCRELCSEVFGVLSILVGAQSVALLLLGVESLYAELHSPGVAGFFNLVTGSF